MTGDVGERARLLTIRGLSKSFGGVRALAGVDFDLYQGEVHALLGENGAGKSTLIKILAGVYAADAGTIEVAGERSILARSLKALAMPTGLQFVHQDLGLIEDLSVTENLALDVGYVRRFGLIRFRETERRAADLLQHMGSDVSPRVLVGDLPQAEKVMIAVTRAFSTKARVIVLDEVTASLPAPEVERLAGRLHAARDSGTGFIFVTHRLDEIFGIADRVTVLRDGRGIATARVDDVDKAQVVEWIVGRRVTHTRKSPTSALASQESLLRVEGLRGPGIGAPVSFEVARGEVVALTGLIGCGAREVAKCLGGSLRPSAGTATLSGSKLRLGDPTALASAGCVYVPGDRQREGAIADLTVRENFFCARREGERVFLRPAGERVAAQRLIERFRVRPADSAERLLGTLSGGNQQKVVVGRALRSEPRLIVLDDPTVGVDVGARAELHALIRAAAASGCGIVLASSDFDEVSTEADRVLVFRRGAIAREINGDDASRALLATESYMQAQENAA